MPVPPYLPQGQEDPSIIAPAPRERDYPLDDEYGHIPKRGPALTPVQPLQPQSVPIDMSSEVGRDNPETMFTPEQNLQRNQAWALPGPYTTQLQPTQEGEFQYWVIANKIPFGLDDPNPDYDMRGFWLAQQKGDPNAITTIDPNDGQPHFPDRWKTPYSPTFSNQSQWAAPNAPQWKGDQYTLPDGRIIYDDKLGQWYGMPTPGSPEPTPPIKKPSVALPDLNVQPQPLQGVPGITAGKGGLIDALKQLFTPNPLQSLQGLTSYPTFGFDPQTFMLSSKEPSYAEGDKIPDAASTDPAIGDLWEKEQQAAGGVNTTTREQGLRDMMIRRSKRQERDI